MTSGRWPRLSAGCPASPRGTAGPGSPSTATRTWSLPPTSRPIARWHTSAQGPSRLSERTQSVLDGSTFVVGDRLGDVRADKGREHGMFSDDARLTSGWALDVRPDAHDAL